MTFIRSAGVEFVNLEEVRCCSNSIIGKISDRVQRRKKETHRIFIFIQLI